MLKLTTPVAILMGTSFGGIFVAIAIFFGLRGRVTPTATSELPAPLVPMPQAVPESKSPSTVELPVAGAVDSAERALLAQRKELVKSCWRPLLSKPPAIGSARYLVRLNFDKTGRQSTKAFLTPMGESRLDVTECIAQTLVPIAIPPQEGPKTFDVSLTLP